MVDPLTLSALGGAVLGQGVTFLYDQASELLKRRRERQEQSRTEGLRQIASEALEGRLAPLVADREVLERHAAELARLLRRLSDYVGDIKEISPHDRDLLVDMDQLRCLLEAVYGQPITFRGEPRRETSGVDVSGALDIEKVSGRSTGIEAEDVAGPATVRHEAKIGHVEAGGEFTGIKINRIDGR